MMRPGMILKTGFLFIIAALLSGAFDRADAKTVKAKKNTTALNIQGFRPGMTVGKVKQLLMKKNIRGYETGFSDLFVYNPAPGTDVKLFFTCTKTANLLSRVELSTAFTAEETEAALPKFKAKLVAKYGMPSIRESQSNVLDFCWGKCGQASKGLKLEAKAAPVQGSEHALVLVLANEGLAKACEEIRHAKINRWLYRWIAHVSKFKLGMTLKDASAFYQKRYQDKLTADEERDEASRRYTVINYVVKAYDFFAGLGYESLAFEGEGPGTVILKFTGDQADKKSKLNKRLYYASFSTTKFAGSRSYGEVQRKLDRFIKVYGKPVDVFPQPDGVMAWWQQGGKKMALSILESGFIRFEQSDQPLKDSYRNQAEKKMEEFHKTRFDKAIF